MKKAILNFRLDDETVFWLRDIAKREHTTMTYQVEIALLDAKEKDKRYMKQELKSGERTTCYHNVPQDGKHYCNICSKLGF